MHFREAIAFLDTLFPDKFRLALEPLKEACELFGNPQNAFPAVHIAGTNGKGSTAAFVHSMLVKSGYRVGLYTSPHLISVRERIQIDEMPLAEEVFAELVERVRNTLPDERMLTYFEFLTLMAFLAFRDQRVDIAVVEVGLGGRWDATNLVEAAVTVVTPISCDHMEQLGATLPLIAAEKCGIFKRGVPAVTAVQQAEVMEVMEQRAAVLGVPLTVAVPQSIAVPLGLAGEHQRQNAACAVAAVRVLEKRGFPCSSVADGLLAAHWPCRLEVVRRAPTILIDGAHNPAGAAALATYLRGYFLPAKMRLLLGILADKDLRGIVQPLVASAREVWCVRAPSLRAALPAEIAAAVVSCGGRAVSRDEPEDAFKGALSGLAADETLVIAGSLTLAGVAKAFFQGIESPLPPLSPMGERDKG